MRRAAGLAANAAVLRGDLAFVANVPSGIEVLRLPPSTGTAA